METNMNMHFDFEMNQFDGRVLHNLTNLLFSYGELINHATGSCFQVQKTLIRLLAQQSVEDSAETFLQTLCAHDAVYGAGIIGVEFSAERVRITGFPQASDMATLKAFGQLAVLIVKYCRECTRVIARQREITNERFSMRGLLVALGMNGPAFKESRSILLRHLQGNSSYCSQASAERAAEKYRLSRASREVKPHGQIIYEYIE